MAKKTLKTIKWVLFSLLLASSAVIGILLYIVFLNYVPGVNINDLFIVRTGLPAFHFFGLSAGILISLPVLLATIEFFSRAASSYVHVISETGFIHLGDKAIRSFIDDVVSDIPGVESLEVSVDIYKENKLGIKIWIDTDEKSDFVRFSERVQQRVLQDLEFNFGIKKIRFFHVFIETTNIKSGSAGYKVNYQ